MNKKLHLTWLTVSVAASALLLGGCVPQDEGAGGSPRDVGASSPDVIGAGRDADEPASGDMAVKISAIKTTVGMDEAVTVRITLTNHAKQPARLLSWNVPDGELEEDVFVVEIAGRAVDFIGPHYKRPAPEDTDYIVLAPGESLTRTVDLTSFYDFSTTGDYSIRYALNYLPHGAREPVTVESKDAALWVEEHPIAGPQEIKSVGGESSLTFSKCTTAQSDTVTQALAAARTMATGASSYLTSTPASGTPRYSTWFGAFSSSGWSTATGHYAAIQDALYTKPMEFDCSCKKKYYAYVYPNQPYKVYLCTVFWGAPMTGTDSMGGTIIHETSHFDVVASTDDWVYGQSGAKSLAISDPAKALDNADSHEYFAENTPSQQ